MSARPDDAELEAAAERDAPSREARALCACGNPKGHTAALVAKFSVNGCTVVCDPNHPTGPGAPVCTYVSLADWLKP